MVRNVNANKTAISVSGGGDRYKVNIPTSNLLKPNLGGALTKSVAWEQVKALGNKAGLKW